MSYKPWPEKLEGKNEEIDPTFTQTTDDHVDEFEDVKMVVAAANRVKENEEPNPEPSAVATSAATMEAAEEINKSLDEENKKALVVVERDPKERVPPTSEHSLENNQQENPISNIAASSLIAEANSLARQGDGDGTRVLIDKHGRPLSTSKRAAQNRNAQRAFRHRKEQYIKDLESQVAGVKNLEEEIENLKNENQELRNYILGLQSKLINGMPPLSLKK
ncbi:Cin5 protein [Saccharomycopsis crataegensis]|uniref:Putative transcription factor kapC n=1 Tax=Saccharomycopsis crataegensis TaxID=43959 RepID=A0AAV5QVL9_9ASCO|nr:Cin5 protein [Saccharomycopsis crataegensis]